MSEPEVMNIRDAAKFLIVSPDKLYIYASTGLVPAFKMGNRWKFSRTTLTTWIIAKSKEGVSSEG